MRLDHLLSRETYSLHYLSFSLLFNMEKTWGISSAGRAPALHAGGQGFKSLILHHHESGKRRESELNGAEKPVQRKANKKPRMHIEN